jgi:hypothetical protein
MERLVAFGCSHTYGVGLPDTAGPNAAQTYSNFAWPSILSNELGLALVNKSYPGWSNNRILQEILSFTFEPEDLVVILWATVDRDFLFLDDGSEFHVGCWNEDTTTKQYYTLHSDLDMAVRTLAAIHHADTFFKLKNIKVKHFLYTNKFYKTVGDARKLCSWFDTDIEYTYIRGMLKDWAADNLHYGIETQKELSNFIKGKI